MNKPFDDTKQALENGPWIFSPCSDDITEPAEPAQPAEPEGPTARPSRQWKRNDVWKFVHDPDYQPGKPKRALLYAHLSFEALLTAHMELEDQFLKIRRQLYSTRNDVGTLRRLLRVERGINGKKTVPAKPDKWA